MTPRQKELARHALGLKDGKKVSYRNSFVAGQDHKDYHDWMVMVGEGLAERHFGRLMPFGGDDLFTLTVEGARAALEKGESLDPEDFPV